MSSKSKMNLLLFDEAWLVSKKGPDIEKAIEKALETVNATAKEKGYTPVKSVDELKKMEVFKVNFKSNLAAEWHGITRLREPVPMTIGGQLVVVNQGILHTQSAVAVYRNQAGKVKGITVPFHSLVNGKGKMKQESVAFLEDVFDDIIFEKE